MFFKHTRFFIVSIFIMNEDCKTRTAFHSLRKFVKIKNFQYNTKITYKFKNPRGQD